MFTASTRFGRPTAVDHPPRSGHPLGDALDLGRTRRERRRTLVAAGLGHHDTDGNREEAGSELGPGAVLELDPAAFPVALVVQIGNRLIEPSGDLSRYPLGHVG